MANTVCVLALLLLKPSCSCYMSVAVYTGAGAISMTINMQQFAYSWQLKAQAKAAAAAAPAHSSFPVCLQTNASAYTPQQQGSHTASVATNATNSTSSGDTSQRVTAGAENAGKAVTWAPAVAATPSPAVAASSLCPSLQQLLPAYALWSPAAAAYAVAALLDRHPAQSEWTRKLLEDAQASNNNSSSDGSAGVCEAWSYVQQSQALCTPIASLAAAQGDTQRSSALPNLIDFDRSSQLVVIRLPQVQLLLAAAVLLCVITVAVSAAIVAGSRPGGTAVTSAAPGAGNVAPTALQRKPSQAQSFDGFELSDIHGRQDDQDQFLGAGSDASDPFGYSGSAAAAGAVQEGAGGGVAAALRRASAMAVGQAAGTLKAAFANKAATATAGTHTAAPGTGADGQAVSGLGPDSAAKAEQRASVAIWDEADEEAVNQLPASIQVNILFVKIALGITASVCIMA